jgi:hypothetical protein
MAARRFPRLLGAAALAFAICASSTTAAHGAVWSDHVKFTAPATPAGDPGTFDFQSTSCKVRSLGGARAKCDMSGHLAFDPVGGAVTGSAVVDSPTVDADFTFTMTPDPDNPGTYKLHGTGTKAPSTVIKVTGKVMTAPQTDGTIALAGGINFAEKG